MSEGEPKFERKDPRAEVVKILRERGMEDPEAHALLKSWVEQLQDREEASPEAHIEASLQVAELLHEAEQFDDAYDYFMDAVDTAAQTPGSEKRSGEIREQMKRIGYT